MPAYTAQRDTRHRTHSVARSGAPGTGHLPPYGNFGRCCEPKPVLPVATHTTYTLRNGAEMITVFYDGKCGLCSKEINHYRTIAPSGAFDWQDITESMAGLEQEGVSLADGLRRLHARDAAGELHVGVDAFILMWRQLKRWRVLAVLVALPGIRQIAAFTYEHFADWRFKRLAHCQVAANPGSPS